ncbi:MAG: EamA family transporter [Planctomycetes bacterium]|nr:EamA family transporter [Planctomycetota bacterium]
MKEWVVYSLITVVFWGVWAFTPKMASMHIKDPFSILFYQFAFSFALMSAIICVNGFHLEYNTTGLIYAVVTGGCATIGTVFFIKAFQTGSNASAVVLITGLYPLIAVPLCLIILKEPLTITKGLGMLFAVVAMVLLSI